MGTHSVTLVAKTAAAAVVLCAVGSVAIAQTPANKPANSASGKPKAAQGPSDPDDPQGNDLNLYTRGTRIAGKDVWIRVRSADADVARKAIDGAVAEIGRVFRKLDKDGKTSEVGSINHIADREEVRVSTETETVLALALKFCRMSDRGFDPTLASFDYLWNLQLKPFVAPLPDEVASRLAMTGCEKLVLKPGRAVRIAQAGVRIDLGEMLAGHALQKAGTLMSGMGIKAFVIRIGQDRYVMGQNARRYWYTPIPHPTHPKLDMMQVYVGSHGVATRSILPGSVLQRGKRYHDVLDPQTGNPATGVIQATVIATDPVMADAMSRALLALGPKRGLAMLAKIDSQVEGFVVDDKGVVHATEGMRSIAPKLPAQIGL